MDLQEDLLHHVLGVGGRTEHPVDEARDVGAVALEELGERVAITLLRARHQHVRVGGIAMGAVFGGEGHEAQG